MIKKIELNIFGMTCASCSAIIQRKLDKEERIITANVNIATHKGKVSFDDKNISENEIIGLIKSAGYEAKINDNNQEDISDQAIEKNRKIFFWSLIFGLPLFYISMGMTIGLPALQISSIANLSLQLILTTAIILINKRIYFSGLSKLIKLKPNMDSLIAVGTLAAFIYSLFIFFAILSSKNLLYDHVYFESAGFILIFISLGKYLEEKTKGKTSGAIKKLIKLQAKTALVLRDEIEVEINISEVKSGDIIIVKAGDKIPVDGKIIFGQSTIDESSITGESIPVFKKIGDKIIGGTINKTSILKFEALGVGDKTMLAQIIKIMEEAISSKAPIQLLADKVSFYFVPTVISLSLLTFVTWYLLGFGFSFALTAFVSVLIIACPCSLGLATPTAVMMGTGLAAKRGILIKNSSALETAGKIKVFVFDKTGTLTKGKPELIEIKTFLDFSEDKILKISYSLAKNSKHPLSEAVVNFAKAKKIDFTDTENFKEYEGMGLKAYCRSHQTRLLLGNQTLLEKEGITPNPEVIEVFNSLARDGKTPLFVSHGDKIIGLIAIIDDIKETSLEAIKELQKRHKEVYMITGDNEKVAIAIAQKLGINKVLAGVLPAEKANKIKDLQKQGLSIAMVGDGINDAPALAQADLGIALASGTDIAIEAGEIILVKNDLRDLVKAIDISKFTLKKIKQNLFWAFIYNIVGIPIAAGVFYFSLGFLLNPMLAAFAMSFSSVSVVSNSLLMKTYKN